jgi:UDP-N-acetylglucosamine transferase subunit ALG13
VILVTTGTNAPPFDRLLREIDKLSAREAVVVQHGPSTLRPAGASCVDYVSFDRFEELVRSSRAVVTHAGVGSVLVALRNGKRPFVVPRLSRFGEHVDDHQLEFALRLSALDVVTLVEDPADLESAIYGPSREEEPVEVGRTGQLVDDLADYLDSVLTNGRNPRGDTRVGERSVVA